MKTLLFTSLFPFAQAPTRGMNQVSMFGAISSHCEVRLIAPLPWWTRAWRPWEWVTVPHETVAGIDAFFPTYWPIPGRHDLQGEAMVRSLRRYVERLRRDFPFDVILAAGAYPDAYAAAQLARDFGCPLVTSVLGGDIDVESQTPEIATLIRQALGQSHRVIAVSDALREQVLELGIAPEKVIVLQNGVDSRSWEEVGKGYYTALASAAGISIRPPIAPRRPSVE